MGQEKEKSLQIYHVAFLLGKANHATILRTTKNIILHSFNKNLWTGIPAMAQWFQWHLCSSRTQAGSPGWHSGLQDPELPQLQIGHNCNSDLIPDLGTTPYTHTHTYAAEQPKKKIYGPLTLYVCKHMPFICKLTYILHIRVCVCVSTKLFSI